MRAHVLMSAAGHVLELSDEAAGVLVGRWLTDGWAVESHLVRGGWVHKAVEVSR
jgi:hypothetical protein